MKQIKYRQTAGVYTEREAKDLAVSQLQDYERELMEKENRSWKIMSAFLYQKPPVLPAEPFWSQKKQGRKHQLQTFCLKTDKEVLQYKNLIEL